MHRHSFIFLILSLFHLLYAQAFPAPQASADVSRIRVPNYLADRRPRPPRPTFPSSCVNTPTTRGCWIRDFNITTNQEKNWPNTGRVVSYNLEVQNLTLAPDGGVARPVYAINGQFPGPTIRCNWGDTLRITVKNSLTTNGTSMHWHGLRQWQSNPMDGTNGITGESSESFRDRF